MARISDMKGELAFALLFACLGLGWMVGALELPLWAGFAPDSGFLPLIYGGLLCALSLGVIVSLLRSGPETVDRDPLGKSLQLLAALVVAVGLAGYIGFALPLFGMMFFMYAWVERLPILRSAIVSAASTAALALVFEHWLAIPLPLTPWGL